MAVERKLDRPVSEGEGNNGFQEIDFQDMYERELVKNHKLQRIIKAQQTHIRHLEQTYGIDPNTETRGYQNQAWGQGGNSWRSNRSSRFTVDSVTAVNQMAARQAVRSPRSLSPGGGRSPRSDGSFRSLNGSGNMVIPPISIKPPTENSLRFPKPTHSGHSPRYSRGPRASPMSSNENSQRGNRENRTWRVKSGNELTVANKLRQELTRNSAVDLRSSKPTVSPRMGRSPVRSRSPSPPSQRAPQAAKPKGQAQTYSAFGSKELVSRDASPTGLLNLHEMLFSQPG